MAKRRQQLGKCQALDQNGRRCRLNAVQAIGYHGDPVLYGYGYSYYFGCDCRATWVRVALCDRHSEPPPKRPGK